MSNRDVLIRGTAKAKRLISQHIEAMMVTIADGLIEDAINSRVLLGHNMTGNTINAYAAGVYNNGRLVHVVTPSGRIPQPLRRKLGRGQRFFAGSQRWDGETQENTFTAQTGSNGALEPEQSIAFLSRYRGQQNTFEVVVCNGIEYATYQLTEMGIDVLNSNFDFAKIFAPSMFKPISDYE